MIDEPKRVNSRKKFKIHRNRSGNKLEIRWITNTGTCCWTLRNSASTRFEEIKIGMDKRPDEVAFVYEIVGDDCNNE